MASFEPSEKEIEATLKLPGEARYKRFIKIVTDWEEAWGLYNDGWALAADDEEKQVFLLWPAQKFAAICAVDQWKEYKPKPIPLDDLLDVLLPKLEADRVQAGIFYTPIGKGVIPNFKRLRADFETELENYV